MSRRPVFMTWDRAPYARTASVEFTYNNGLSVAQKRRNVEAIHEAFGVIHPEMKVLEISSKSMEPLGVALSAFNLKKFVPSLGKSISVENVFQGGKKFTEAGPFDELYGVSPRDAKRDERLKASGRLTAFVYEGAEYPIEPKTAFYNWIYMNALLENEELARQLMEYDAFTDVEFNPEKSLNCQARAAAVFVSLTRLGLAEQIRTFDGYMKLAV